METESIRHVLSLLKEGGQSQTILVHPATSALPPAKEGNLLPWDHERSSTPALVPWYAYLLIERGQVSSCELRNEQGDRLLTGAAAMNVLEHSGRLRWQIVSSAPFPPPQAAQPEVEQSRWRPVRTALGKNMLRDPAAQLPRDSRRLLVLLNGQHTVEDLYRLLGPPGFEDLQQMLRSLKDSGLIQ